MTDPTSAPFGFLAEIWSRPWVKLAVWAAAAALGIEVLVLLWPYLKLLLVALVLAYLFDPVVDRLERRGLSRTSAVLALIGSLAILGIGAVALLVPAIAGSLNDFFDKLPEYGRRAQDFAVPILRDRLHLALPASVSDVVEGLRANQGMIQDFAQRAYEPALAAIRQAAHGVQGLVSALFGLIVVPVAWFYLLRDIDPIKAAALDLVPKRWRGDVRANALEIDGIVSGFMRGQVTVCLILACIYAVGLQFIAGVPLGALIGLCAGIVSFVPYLGLILGIVPALVLAVLEHGDLLHPGLVVAVFAVAQALEGNVITPKIVGEKLGLHPVTVIFAIMVWGGLLGLVGMVIAVPATAVLQVFGSRLVRRYRTSGFYAHAGGR